MQPLETLPTKTTNIALCNYICSNTAQLDILAYLHNIFGNMVQKAWQAFSAVIL